MEGRGLEGGVLRKSGNIFFLLFAAVGMAGVVALSIQSYVMGPLKGASKVTRNNSAQTQMQLGIRVAATNAVTQQAGGGDCDGDGMVEPLPYVDAGVAAHPTGGGYLPNNVGSVKMDPWGTQYGYCVWDHGSAIDDAGCGGAPQLRLPGTDGQEWETMAVISAGPDRVFQTSCNAWADVNADNLPDTPLVDKPASSDDVYFSWSYQDATTGSGGLWTLETLDPNTAEINKNISVKDGSNVEQLSFDATTKALSVGSGGSGEFPTVKTDYIQALTNPSIQLLDAIQFSPEDGSGTTFTVQNATGDHLRVSTGTYDMLSFESTLNEIGFKNISTATEGMYYYYSSSRPYLGITSASNTDYTTGLTLANTNSAGIVDKTHFVEGQHTATSLETVGTSQVLFGLEATGAGAANMAGYMAFTTRPTGTAYAATLPERMRITSAGDVGIGTNNPQGRLHVAGGDTIIQSTKIGIGNTSPTNTIQVSGSMKVGSSVAACSTTYEGSLRYNSSLSCLELCDGSNWTCIQSTACGTMTPAAVSFTNVTGASPSTVTESNIVQITGIGTCQIPVTVSSTNAPEYRICTNGTSDAACDASVIQNWTTSRTPISNNQYLQLRTTSYGYGGIPKYLYMVVGARSFSWSVTASDSCASPSPTIGTLCADGTLYVGLSPDGGTKMYIAPCLIGSRYITQGSCDNFNHAYEVPWAATNASVTTSMGAVTGETNTSTLAGLSNADSPYSAAQICQNLSYGGKTDWYLPSETEAGILQAACTNLSGGGLGCNAIRIWASTEWAIATARYYTQAGALTQSTKHTVFYNLHCVRKD